MHIAYPLLLTLLIGVVIQLRIQTHHHAEILCPTSELQFGIDHNLMIAAKDRRSGSWALKPALYIKHKELSRFHANFCTEFNFPVCFCLIKLTQYSSFGDSGPP